MKHLFNLFIIILASISFSSCDELDGPEYFEENKSFSSDTINKVLIEEFTGHKCGNCPRAHQKLAELKSTYHNAIVPVAYHVGFFAVPSMSGESYLTDFRTTSGDEINAHFNVSEGAGLPAGIVNRTAKPESDNNNVVLYEQDWESVINYYLNKPVDALMNITCSYNSETHEANGNINVEFLNELEKEIKLVIYIVEDSIVKRQKDYDNDPVDIENYTHRHVFRDAISSTWGETLVNDAVAPGQIENNSFAYTLNESWVAENCEIIAYIYDAETLEIIQAEYENVFP